MTAVWVTALIACLSVGTTAQIKFCSTEFGEASGAVSSQTTCFHGDIGYFLFVELGGYGRFVPTILFLISATAVVLSGWAWFSLRKAKTEDMV